MSLQDIVDNDFQSNATLHWEHARTIKPKVRHIRQRKAWDCGLACVQMIIRLHSDNSTWQEIYLTCRTSSIWTIHLSSALLQRGVPHVITTTCAGVNQDLESLSFYRDHIQKEEKDVMLLFENSLSSGVSIIERGFSSAEFQQLLQTRCVVLILLVDNRKLRCIECGCLKRNWFSCSFTGHYVVVSSYDEERNAFVYHDPASGTKTCWMSNDDFDRCRLVKGTDEDVVIVPYQGAAAGGGGAGGKSDEKMNP